MLCKNHSGCLMTAGKLPEFVAKWITAHGITPGVLTLHQQDDGGGEDRCIGRQRLRHGVLHLARHGRLRLLLHVLHMVLTAGARQHRLTNVL